MCAFVQVGDLLATKPAALAGEPRDRAAEHRVGQIRRHPADTDDQQGEVADEQADDGPGVAS
jgi:hypothetical protein